MPDFGSPRHQNGKAFDMTMLLGRVADREEAEIGVSGKVDIIDMAIDPARPGLPDDDAVLSIAADLGGRHLLSASLAEPGSGADQLFARANALSEAGFGMLKLGPFAEPHRAAMLAAMRPLAGRSKLFAVIPADQDVRQDQLFDVAAHGFAGVMIETATDRPSRLLDLRSPTFLKGFIEDCHRLGLKAGLSGALEPPDVARLLPLEPDILGFRLLRHPEQAEGAGLNAEALARMRNLIPPDLGFQSQRMSDAKLDYRLLAARGHGESEALDGDRLDRVLVRDFILSLSIGAYDRERQLMQRVRINVEVDILRKAQATEMRDIFSYDVVTDAIRMIADEGHVEFVETFAERIAAEVLRHKRVFEIMVRVEKLDVGPGSVGIEIRRDRKAQSGTILEFYPNLGRG
jgi:dihydroneopterin aldolase